MPDFKPISVLVPVLFFFSFSMYYTVAESSFMAMLH